MSFFLKNIFFIVLTILCFPVVAQYNANFYMKATEQAERAKTHGRIIQNIINKNLNTPLSDETEDGWEAAFDGMEVMEYHNAFTWQKMQEAMADLPFRSVDFQRRTLETAYMLYAGNFVHEANSLMHITTTPKIFAMCAVYLLKSDSNHLPDILSTLHQNFGDSALTDPILNRLTYELSEGMYWQSIPSEILKEILGRNFLAGNTLLISFQRRNRDYPGMAMVRKKDGSFVKINGDYLHIPQLARGIASLPYYLTKGNTPQGIYRMFGFGVSMSQFIGPTANVQMGMPNEISKSKFFDKTLSDDKWTFKDYTDFLPEKVREYQPLYESYFAGLSGRNEIIAHGTTIDPELYAGKPYYPMTPSEGCLSTKEFWDGKLIYSDQQKLVNALLEAGGAKGYVVVIDIDNKNEPVTMNDVKMYLP